LYAWWLTRTMQKYRIPADASVVRTSAAKKLDSKATRATQEA